MLIDTADEESLKARTGAESESKMKKREDEELALAEKKDGKELSPKELEVLECLWSAKKAKSVPKIVKLLREKTDQEYAESTVRTFLTRIEKKGYVRRFKDGQNYYYEPTIGEKDYRMSLHRKYIRENMRDEEYDVILELFKRGKFSKKEIKTMKKLINDMEK